MKLNAGRIDMGIIIVCLVLIELVFRAVAPLVSGNVKQISEISDTAADLLEKERSVLFLGNSLMGNALDLNRFDKQANVELASYKVVPDGTSLWDWLCIVNDTFIDKGRKPTVIVIGYAWEQAAPVPARLGGFFCSMNYLPELIRLGMDDLSDIFEFMVSKVSRLYAMHETVRKRILNLFIPEYSVYTQVINDERNKKRREKDMPDKVQDYSLLKAYLGLLEENNIKAVIVAMPVKDKYTLNKAFFSIVREYGGTVLDYRQLDGLGDSMFRDAIHLNEQGREVFTKELSAYFKKNKRQMEGEKGYLDVIQ